MSIKLKNIDIFVKHVDHIDHFVKRVEINEKFRQVRSIGRSRVHVRDRVGSLDKLVV